MRYTIDVHPDYIKAEMREREAGEETRAFVEAILAALRQHPLQRLLISVRSSRPVFKVEQYGLSDALVQVAGTGYRRSTSPSSHASAGSISGRSTTNRPRSPGSWERVG